MYESPITKIMGEIQEQLIRADENNLMYSVKQSVGYSVDKEELLKALNYDRDQYRKGYQDGFNAGEQMRITWHTEDPPNEESDYLVTYSHGAMDICRWTDASYFGGHEKTNWHWIHAQFCEVIAWMPLPEPYVPEINVGKSAERSEKE